MLLEKDLFIDEVLEHLRRYRIFPKPELKEGEFPLFFDSNNQSKYIQESGFCRYCPVDLHITPRVKRKFMIGLDYPIGADNTNFMLHQPTGAITVQDDALRRMYGYPDISAKFDFKTQSLSGFYVSSVPCYFDKKICKLIQLPPIQPNNQYIKPISIETAIDTMLSSIFSRT